MRHCQPTNLHPLRRPLHRAGFPVRHCSPTDLHPLRRPLHRAGFLVRHCRPTHLHPLRRPLHRAGFPVRHCRPTDLHPLRRPLHRAGFLVRHCRPTDTPIYDVPSIVLVSRCDTAVLRTASSLCYNIPSTVLFPRSPEHAIATTRQASVNSDNLVTLTVPHKATSHPTGNSRPPQNSLRLAYFNAQSCRQKASEINDLVVDGDFDILLMTETWLYASGDEAYITEMTTSGYLFHSFPRIGRRGGGIAIMFKSALSDSISIHPLPFNSFKSVELRLSNDSTSVSVICLYRPPPSKQNKLSNKMFFEEFPSLVSEYSHARRDLAFIGDFNFHFEDSSSGDVDQLKTLLNDHDLVQLVDMPTHKRGHVLDWVIVRRDASCLSLETVEDIALSDHSATYCSVNVRRPTARKRLVTSRNLRAMNSTDFQADIKSFAESAGDQCADPGLLDVYDTGLRQVLDRHAPLTTRRVSDRPSAPWMTDGIKAAKRELRQAERQWRDTRLTVHREIYTKQRGVVKTLVRAARKLHFSAGIENCSNTKQLFSVSSGLLGKSKTTPLPSDIPRSALQDRFCMFFSQKIQNIRQDLDAHPSEPATFSPYDGPKLCLFQPVTEEEIRKLIVESPTKTCMLDPILTSLTKECLSDLQPLITRIVNSSLGSGVVPPQFKQAVVTPMLKKPELDPNDLKNFRPMSNLPFISKILEK